MVEVWKNLLVIVSAMQTMAFGGNKPNNNYLNEFECLIITTAGSEGYNA